MANEELIEKQKLIREGLAIMLPCDCVTEVGPCEFTEHCDKVGNPPCEQQLDYADAILAFLAENEVTFSDGNNLTP